MIAPDPHVPPLAGLDDGRAGQAPPDSSSQFGDGGPGSQLTPMGQVDSIGAFARGLGPRRTKIALAVIGGVALLVAVIAAVV